MLLCFASLVATRSPLMTKPNPEMHRKETNKQKTTTLKIQSRMLEDLRSLNIVLKIPKLIFILGASIRPEVFI